MVAGNAAGSQIQLGDELQIGRSAPEEGRLGDDPELSRAHAKVTRDPQGQIVVEDLGSTNGTAVNGQRITGPTVLKPGDTLQVGKSQLQFQGGAPDPGATKLGAGAGAAIPPPPPAAAAPPPPPPAAAPPPPPPPPAATPATPPPPQFGGPAPGGPGAPAAADGGGRRKLLLALGGLLAVVLLVVLIAALSGGGDDSSEDDARGALASFIEDPDCDALTERAAERFFGGEEACAQALPDGVEEGDFTIASISVDGEQAEADVDSDEDVDGDWELEEDGGEWKIDSLPAALAQAGGAQPTDTGATPAPEPTTTQEEDPRRIEAIATLEALIQAVKDDDAEVFCGLLSPRQAQRLVGGAGGDAAIARCVEVSRRVDLSENVPDEISVTGVRVSGNQASVRLTTGERFTLVRRRGRFVIDTGLG